MKKVFLIIGILVLITDLHGQRFSYLPFGPVNEKTSEGQKEEKDKLFSELERKNIALKNKIEEQNIIIAQLQDNDAKKDQIIIDLKRKNDSLLLVIGKNEKWISSLLKSNKELTEKYIAATDTILEKNKQILNLQRELNSLEKERDKITLELAQKSPDWNLSSCDLSRHSSVNKGYILSLNANTKNFSHYFYTVKEKHPDASIIASLVRLKTNKKNEVISDIGNGEFKSCEIFIHHAADITLYFKTQNRLSKYKEIYPIIYFYLYYDGKQQEQLGIIDNIKIEM